MTKKTMTMTMTTTVRPEPRGQGAWQWFLSAVVPGIAIILWLTIHRDQWEAGSYLRDVAYFSYVGEMTSRGFLLYRDIFSLQPPLQLWLMEVACSWGGSSGLVVLGLLEVGLLAAVAGVAGQICLGNQCGRLRSWTAGLVVFGVAAGWRDLNLFVPAGGKPSVIATVLLLLAVILLARRHALLCGMSLAAACLAWQPSVVIAFGVVAAGLVWTFARKQSFGWVVRVVMGGVVFSGIAAGILAVRGNLVEFFEQAVLFALENPTQGESESRSALFAKLGRLLPIPLQFLAGAGFVWVAWCVVRGAGSFVTKRTGEQLPEDATLLRAGVAGWTLVYSVFFFFNFQGRGDLFPLLAPIGVALGWLFGSARIGPVKWAALILVGTVTAWILVSDRPPMARPGLHRARVEAIQNIARGEGIAIWGDPYVQFGVDREPAHPHVYWETGTRAWLDDRGSGSERLVEKVMEPKPGAVVIGSRAEEIRPLLDRWLDAEYERIPGLCTAQSSLWVRRDLIHRMEMGSGE